MTTPPLDELLAGTATLATWEDVPLQYQIALSATE
jgi:hypothetical protein